MSGEYAVGEKPADTIKEYPDSLVRVAIDYKTFGLNLSWTNSPDVRLGWRFSSLLLIYIPVCCQIDTDDICQQCL